MTEQTERVRSMRIPVFGDYFSKVYANDACVLANVARTAQANPRMFTPDGLFAHLLAELYARVRTLNPSNALLAVKLAGGSRLFHETHAPCREPLRV